jgi:hypothetical protein
MALLYNLALVSGAMTARNAVLSRTLPLAPRAVRLMSAGASLEDDIQKTVSTNKVVVYSKTTCPFCAMTKGLFEKLDITYTAIELDQTADGCVQSSHPRHPT